MRRFLVAFLLLALVGCARPPETVHLFAAASTQEVVTEIARDFEASTGIHVTVSLDASSRLARQIEAGADADLFLSANERWADFLADKGLVEQRRDLLGNRLVVIVPADSTVHVESWNDLKNRAIRHLALGNEAVPAGTYARQALKKAGVWEAVKDRILEGSNVRAVLTYVQRGEAEAGLVYATDAATTPRVRVAFTAAADLHEPIRYPLVLVRRPTIQPGARRFYEYLGSDKAAAVFRRAGFQVPGGSAH